MLVKSILIHALAKSWWVLSGFWLLSLLQIGSTPVNYCLSVNECELFMTDNTGWWPLREWFSDSHYCYCELTRSDALVIDDICTLVSLLGLVKLIHWQETDNLHLTLVSYSKTFWPNPSETTPPVGLMTAVFFLYTNSTLFLIRYPIWRHFSMIVELWIIVGNTDNFLC